MIERLGRTRRVPRSCSFESSCARSATASASAPRGTWSALFAVLEVKAPVADDPPDQRQISGSGSFSVLRWTPPSPAAPSTLRSSWRTHELPMECVPCLGKTRHGGSFSSCKASEAVLNFGSRGARTGADWVIGADRSG